MTTEEALNDKNFLKEEQDFCDTHWGELREKYTGRYIIIRKTRVIAVFSKYRDATETAALQHLKQGEYMIKEITDTNYEMPIHISRVFL